VLPAPRNAHRPTLVLLIMQLALLYATMMPHEPVRGQGSRLCLTANEGRRAAAYPLWYWVATDPVPRWRRAAGVRTTSASRCRSPTRARRRTARRARAGGPGTHCRPRIASVIPPRSGSAAAAAAAPSATGAVRACPQAAVQATRTSTSAYDTRRGAGDGACSPCRTAGIRTPGGRKGSRSGPDRVGGDRLARVSSFRPHPACLPARLARVDMLGGNCPRAAVKRRGAGVVHAR